jgi:hypothetical protein
MASSALARFGFEARGPLCWAMLVPLSHAALEARVADEQAEDLQWREPSDGPLSFRVLAGTARHSAYVETEPGSTCTGIDLAEALSRELSEPVYLIELAGYDDPDHGIPSITRYEKGESALLYFGATDEGERLESVPGPPGVPCDDPFRFAEALGVSLR